MVEPIAYIKDREVTYMLGAKQAGGTEWHTNLSFEKADGDLGLYTQEQVWKILDTPFEDKYGLHTPSPKHTPLEKAVSLALYILNFHVRPKSHFSWEELRKVEWEVESAWQAHLRSTRDEEQYLTSRRQFQERLGLGDLDPS
jgi:hypothetical protein